MTNTSPVAATPPPIEGQRPLVYYGWWIVIGALVAQFIAMGQNEATNLILGPMTEELGWTRSQFILPTSIGVLLSGGLGFFVGAQVDRSPRDADGAPTGFDLQVGGLSPALVAEGAPPIAAPWRLSGTNGTDRIQAAFAEAEAADAGATVALDLDLRAVKPAALHDGDGFIDFGPAGSSYYYSRTKLAATGELRVQRTWRGEGADTRAIALANGGGVTLAAWLENGVRAARVAADGSLTVVDTAPAAAGITGAAAS